VRNYKFYSHSIRANPVDPVKKRIFRVIAGSGGKRPPAKQVAFSKSKDAPLDYNNWNSTLSKM